MLRAVLLLQAKFLLGAYQQHAADAGKLNTVLELGCAECVAMLSFFTRDACVALFPCLALIAAVHSA